ncbi:unnamed protein product [Rotaria socialis]|nr:unnamed protein product [Rotaria socialis]CAF4540864.1 unnamed protein product [Rotaria socialis]CAF4634655.1 unnamed protein product [Rotaria socialis]
MDEYDKNNLKKVNNKLFRYVDDLPIVTKMYEDELKSYVDEQNSLKGTIKFTHEFEENNQLNYLNTTLTWNTTEKRIDIKWYRKDTGSNRLLHYESGHHKSVKINIIKNMTNRIIDTTRNNIQQKDDLNKLSGILIKSKYRKYFIDDTIMTCLKQVNNNIIPTTNTIQTFKNSKNDMEYILSLPYVNGMKVLKRKFEKLNNKLDFSYPKKLNSLVTSTIKPPSKAVVYQIECECGSIYNGETKVGLTNRSKQHDSIIEKDDENSSSEMVQHHRQNLSQCMLNPNLSFMIDSDADYRKRRIKEVIYSVINNSINKHDNIDNTWNNILHKESIKIRQHIKFKKKINTLKQTE